jgi:hypothetical protein
MDDVPGSGKRVNHLLLISHVSFSKLKPRWIVQFVAEIVFQVLDFFFVFQITDDPSDNPVFVLLLLHSEHQTQDS